MTEFAASLVAAWQATSTLEVFSVVFGLLYVVLAARENIWCWPAALLNTSTAIVLFWDARLIMESGLNIFYLLIAIFGWWQWRYGGEGKSELSIRSWRAKEHLMAIAAIALLTVLSGRLLGASTNAALPYLDSFTTWSAVICTWMVTRKILQNWLYWLVIDAASIYLYLSRELYLYAALFLVYIVIALYGYYRWRQHYQQNMLGRHIPLGDKS